MGAEIASAAFDATGVRLLQLPVVPEGAEEGLSHT
jgi:CO/xanthine dehydrogenase Mo-binding subunit